MESKRFYTQVDVHMILSITLGPANNLQFAWGFQKIN